MHQTDMVLALRKGSSDSDICSGSKTMKKVHQKHSKTRLAEGLQRILDLVGRQVAAARHTRLNTMHVCQVVPAPTRSSQGRVSIQTTPEVWQALGRPGARRPP